MEIHGDWFESISTELCKIHKQLHPIDQRKYKLPLFMRIARRVADFSNDCEECWDLKNQINKLSEELTCSQQLAHEIYRNYLTTVKSITRHLKRKHRLVDEKQYVKLFVPISTVFGLSLVMSGLVLINFGISILVLSITLPALFIRVIFSYVIGHFLDNRAKKQDRVI